MENIAKIVLGVLSPFKERNIPSGSGPVILHMCPQIHFSPFRSSLCSKKLVWGPFQPISVRMWPTDDPRGHWRAGSRAVFPCSFHDVVPGSGAATPFHNHTSCQRGHLLPSSKSHQDPYLPSGLGFITASYCCSLWVPRPLLAVL